MTNMWWRSLFLQIFHSSFLLLFQLLDGYTLRIWVRHAVNQSLLHDCSVECFHELKIIGISRSIKPEVRIFHCRFIALAQGMRDLNFPSSQESYPTSSLQACLVDIGLMWRGVLRIFRTTIKWGYAFIFEFMRINTYTIKKIHDIFLRHVVQTSYVRHTRSLPPHRLTMRCSPLPRRAQVRWAWWQVFQGFQQGQFFPESKWQADKIP